MIEIEIADIEEYQVQQIFEVLQDAWKRVKSWSVDSLLYRDSKLWNFNETIVGFSCWYVGGIIITHSLSYHAQTKICINTIKATSRVGFVETLAHLFSEALHLAFSNDFIE